MDHSFEQASTGSEIDKLDLILLALERLQQDLHLAKCEIKTAVREISLHQNSIYDLYLKFRGDFLEINERLHGMELQQQRQQNSST